MRRLTVLSLIISGLAFTHGAWAQEMPPFAMPQIITDDEVANLSVDFDDAFNTIENPYLSDTMKLNYQISLLEKLVTRQAALTKIEDSYASLGMSFTPPPPPKGICAQLPANGPCLGAYPELYSDLVAERKAYYKTLEIRLKDAEPDRKRGESDEEMIARQKKEAEERAAREEAIARRTRYQWAEVTCLSDDCHGVLVRSDNPDVRYTVRNGTKLPDGTVVESMRPGDIRVTIGGEMIKIRPAPGKDSGVAAANAAAISPLSSTLENAGVSASPAEGAPGTATIADSKAAAASIVANAGGAPAPSMPSIKTPPVTTPLPPAAPAGPTAGSAPATGNDTPLGPSGLF